MSAARHEARRGFTLFETLVVLALLGIVATIAIPAIYHVARKNPMRQATDDLVDGCRNARMLAIMEGAVTELVINAGDGALSVRLAESVLDPEANTPAPAPEPMADGGEAPRPASPVPKFSAHLPESVAFKSLVVNLRDMMDSTEARIRFYPNGTSDALSATLLSEQNEERRLTLEITTGRESIDVIR